MIVSVPYGDLFYFYVPETLDPDAIYIVFPSPMGIFFISIANCIALCNITFWFPSPMGIFFISIFPSSEIVSKKFMMFPSPMGIFFISMVKQRDFAIRFKLFPSPMGIFFISILSYGNFTGHGENLHFAVQKVFSGKIRGFEALKLLYPLIICPAVQNYDSTSSILPIP